MTTNTFNKKELHRRIPGMLRIAAIFKVAHKVPNFQKYIKELMVNRIDVAAEILAYLKIKPEEFGREIFGDVKEIAVHYITQGKINEMVELKNFLNLSPENLKEILLLTIAEQTLNPNYLNVKSFIEKRDFNFNAAQLKEDVQIKEFVKKTAEELESMSFSPNGKDLKNESKELKKLFGIKTLTNTEEPVTKKKNPFDFGKNDFDFGDLDLDNMKF